MDARFCDEFEHGFGWVVEEHMQRCSHALAADGGVWLVDPLDWEPAIQRARELGEPRGVIQLLDRHERGSVELARRLGVPHHVVPREPITGAPFEFRVIQDWRRWREVALWWPAESTLVSADALGTAPYYRAGGERLAVHPLLRLTPPRKSLAGVAPARVLCGHGEGVLDDAPAAFREALDTSRRRMPRALLSSVARLRRG